MQAYLINLDRATERRTWMEARLEALAVRYQRVRAVDGRELSIRAIQQAVRSETADNPLSTAEVACFLSHKNCWERIADGSAPYGAVLEDDIYLDDVVGPLLSTHEWIPRNVRILKLEATHQDLFIGSAPDSSSELRIYRTRAAWVGSAGYIISRQAAKALLAAGPMSCPVDKFLFDKRESSRLFDTHEIQPGICIQATQLGVSSGFLASTIGPERMRMPLSEDVSKPKVQRNQIVKIAREAIRPFKRLKKRIERLQAKRVILPNRAAH